MGVTVNCEWCSEQIVKFPRDLRRTKHHFCNKACHDNYQRQGKTKLCSNCTQLIKRKPYTWKDQSEAFCCTKCRSAFVRTKWIALTCTQCGKDYRMPPAVYRQRTEQGNEHWFFSNACQGKYENQQIETVCTHCTQALLVPRHRYVAFAHFFCGHECYGQWQIGVNNHQWKGGWSGRRNYGPNWATQRQLAIERDEYMCRALQCNAKHIGTRLHVHHIRRFREYGYIPGTNEHYLAANMLSNLITLCGACHKKAEHGKIAFQPKLL